MKLLSKISILAILFITFSCEKPLEYKFSDKPDILTDCDIPNKKLIKEALYSFEDDLMNNFDRNQDFPNLMRAYSRFIYFGIEGSVDYNSIISQHTLDVFKALQNETELWNTNSKNSNFNYKSDLGKCIAEHIKDQDLKTTYNALLSVNSLNPKLFGAPFYRKYQSVITDKYLATYVAFDLFYAYLIDKDLTTITPIN